MSNVADVESNADIEIEEEESEQEDGEEVVVQGSMQFTLVPKPDSSTTSSLSAALVEVRPTSPSVRIEAQKSPVPIEDLVSTTFRTPDGSVVYVIGTAHFSLESQAKVREVISRVKPSVIMLELCSSRVSLLRLDEETLLREAKEINIRTVRNVIRNLGVVMGTMHLLLLSMSAEITRICGMAPGGEFRCAVTEAKKIPNCMVSLGDRPMDITVKRAFAALSLWHKIKFAFHVIFQSSSITKDDIEKCMETDAFQAVMEELAGKFPALSRVFISERDTYLAHSLQVAVNSNIGPNGQLAQHPRVVVGIVGLGHVEGIKKRFGTVQIEEVMAVLTVPKPSLLGKVVRLTIKAGVICVVVYSVKRFAPRPTYLSMENLTPHLEKMNDSVRHLTKMDLVDVTTNLTTRMTSAFDTSRRFVLSYL